MPATRVGDVPVVWGVGTDTGRDSHLSVPSSHFLQLFPMSSEEKIVAQVEKNPKGSILPAELPAGPYRSSVRSSKHAEVIFNFPLQRRKKSWKINIISVFHRRQWTDCML